jgi:hypothetical protein
MTCQDFDKVVGHYVDATIGDGTDGTAFAPLQGHLATCARCAALEADLRAIRAAARALPPHQPAAHVWTAVEAAMALEHASAGDARRDRERAGFRWQRAWQPLAAAAMAVIVASALAVVGMRHEPLKQAPGSGPAGIAAAAPAPADLVRNAEVEYIQAITGLEAITSTAADTLDAETAGVLKANLTVIDQAIGESRAALKEEPESRLAIASLFEALRSKLSLLQDMVALINEMRQGNAEGAARIASGLNQ